MSTEISLEHIVLTRIHVGHRRRRSQHTGNIPSYIYCIKNGVAIIDLTQTRIQLKKAELFLSLLRSHGKRVLFVGNEMHTPLILEERRRASYSFFVNTRWLGGTLTNLATIQTPCSEHKPMAKRQLRRQQYLDGLMGINSIPGAVIILTQKTSLVPIKECRKLGIPTVCVVDTDCDPNLTTLNIPMNDDSRPRLHLFLEAILPHLAMGRAWWLSMKVKKNKSTEKWWF